MGQAVSSALICRRIPDLRVLIRGLDAAGKTAILYRLKTGELISTIPTIGFNVELVNFDGRAKLTMWDMGGRDKMRALYRHYYPDSHGVLYIIDSTDQARLSESIEELIDMCNELDRYEVGSIPVALLCNKSDLNPQLAEETCEQLRNTALSISRPSDEGDIKKTRRPCRCFAVSAATGDGLAEAMDWLLASALHELPRELEEETDEKDTSTQVGKTVEAPEVSNWRHSLYSLVKSVMLR